MCGQTLLFIVIGNCVITRNCNVNEICVTVVVNGLVSLPVTITNDNSIIAFHLLSVNRLQFELLHTKSAF